MDGSATPELIPDDLAYNHLLITLAERRNPTKEEARRRESRVLPLHLTVEDQRSLVNALQGLREILDDIDAARSAAASESDSLQIKSRFESAMKAARDRVRASLSEQGLANVDSFVQTRVKAAIVIYGSN